MVSSGEVSIGDTVLDENGSILDVFLDDMVFTEDMDDLSVFCDLEQLYYPLIVKASRRYKVDPLLVKAMIAAESGFNTNAVSHVGAQGLMQLMPSTAKALGVKDSFNPEHNINGGVKYFKKLLDRFHGDVRLALAAYNAGSRKVHKYRGVPPFAETRKYIDKVFKLHTDFKNTESVSLKRVLLSQS
ncbi:MAG: lytic transglycosylase domain-containing protein [Proteobacteria bacterium]|nr:lytic transglycosylase domain-containing protein [Pseudomonadota bacterium]